MWNTPFLENNLPVLGRSSIPTWLFNTSYREDLDGSVWSSPCCRVGTVRSARSIAHAKRVGSERYTCRSCTAYHNGSYRIYCCRWSGWSRAYSVRGVIFRLGPYPGSLLFAEGQYSSSKTMRATVLRRMLPSPRTYPFLRGSFVPATSCTIRDYIQAGPAKTPVIHEYRCAPLSCSDLTFWHVIKSTLIKTLLHLEIAQKRRK